MSKIIVNGSLIPSVKNAPLDIRTRINTIAEVESIQVPFVGMIFYVIDEEKFYVVKTLKGSNVGNIELKDTTIDTYEPLAAEVDLNGYATEEFVQDAIKNIQVGEDVDLSDYAKISFVEEQIGAIEHPQYDDTELREAVDNKVDKIEGKVLIDEAEVERLANVDNYDDSELRVLIDEEKPYLADIAAYPTSKFLFACGQPMTVEPNVGHKYSAEHAEDDVAFVYRWAEGFECIMVEKAVAEKVYLVGGFGHKNIGARRSIPQTNMVVRNVKIKGLVGGNYFEGMVGHVNMEAENCEFVSVIGGGWCGASVNGKATRMNVADDIKIKMTSCKVSSTLFGGSQGNGVSDDIHMELNNCNIGWLTAGGANGMTRNAVVVLNGGMVKVAQSTNRGIVFKARFVMNDGVVNKLYFGGETEDATVNGIIEDGFVELNGGIVNQFNFGTNNGVEMTAENIKGCIMNCMVANGDVSMLEEKVEDSEVDIDLSEYAKVEFVEEQIANIELKEGPAGKDFTYDMFTEEQLQALRGPEGAKGEPGAPGEKGERGEKGEQGEKGEDFKYEDFTLEQLEMLTGPRGLPGEKGEQGADGINGQDGKDFTYDMFTDEQLEALRGPKGEAGKDGENGQNGQDGADGISVQNVAIENSHLMVTLSNGQVLDAGEMPAGQGGAGMTDEERQELENLKEMKQQFLDLTYGVEYEWLYEFAQPAAALNVIGFNRENAPGFFADLDEAGEEGLEEFITNVMEQDIYRMYVLRLSSEHRMYNRYEMIPFDGHATQPEASEFLAGWNPTANLHSWTWDGDFDGGFRIDAKPSSALVVALLKVKK